MSLSDPGLVTPQDPRFLAGYEMLFRTGATGVQLRYSDDEQPTVWFAVAQYERDGATVHEAAASLNPVLAILRLCERLIDGAQCVHCGRVSAFEADHATPTDTPLDRAAGICWYQWDPELATFRRGCEAD